MVDCREKGARAELNLRDLMRDITGLQWDRTPSSGALDKRYGLKGDLFVSGNVTNNYCIEVKHYADPQYTTKILTDKNPTFMQWWAQTIREANEVGRKPILAFKHDRSKWFVAMPMNEPNNCENYLTIKNEIKVCLLQDWLACTEVKWIND